MSVVSIQAIVVSSMFSYRHLVGMSVNPNADWPVSDDVSCAAFARRRAVEIFRGEGRGMISTLSRSKADGIQSFMVAPNGLRPGMERQERADEFVAWLEKQTFVDGSRYLQWAVVDVSAGDKS